VRDLGRDRVRGDSRPPLPPQGYVRDSRPRRVDYRAASVSADTGFHATDEADNLAWVSMSEAMQRLTYPRDASRWPASPSPARTPYRSYSSGTSGPATRRRWSGADRDRPLDASGEEQATALAELLGCFGPRRLISAPAKRCVQTLEWYADSIGAEIEISQVLSLSHEAATLSALEDAIAEAQSPPPPPTTSSQTPSPTATSS
jgi:8-oxo-(d)GTP phosphatase